MPTVLLQLEARGMLSEDTPTTYTVVRSGSTGAVLFAVDLKTPQNVEARGRGRQGPGRQAGA